MNVDELKMRIAELEREIEDAKRRLPAHSIRPHQMMEIERMEDELAELRGELARLLDGLGE